MKVAAGWHFCLEVLGTRVENVYARPHRAPFRVSRRTPNHLCRLNGAGPRIDCCDREDSVFVMKVRADAAAEDALMQATEAPLAKIPFEF